MADLAEPIRPILPYCPACNNGRLSRLQPDHACGVVCATAWFTLAWSVDVVDPLTDIAAALHARAWVVT